MAKKTREVAPIRIDLGSGANKREGFIGVDKYKMKGVDVVCDLGKDTWPWADNSVDEAHCSHFIEHLTNQNGKWERTHFFNELYRVLKKGSGAFLIFPHWSSNRYYGDPTHCEPFSEMGFYYLDKAWRESQAPHTDKKWNKNGYNCDFEFQVGYNLHQSLMTRNEEYRNNAMNWYKEACQDIVATIRKK